MARLPISSVPTPCTSMGVLVVALVALHPVLRAYMGVSRVPALALKPIFPALKKPAVFLLAS